MKKILLIKGSARENGFTNTALKAVADEFKNCSVTVFDTYKAGVKPCTGCNFCEENSRCVYNDLDAFYNEFEECDEVYFFSPVYNGCFSAPVKALIDRFQVYYTSFYKNAKVQKIKKHRKAYLICAAGRDGEEAFLYMQKQLKCAFTILNCTLEKSFLLKNTDTQRNYSEFLNDLKRSLIHD